MARLLTYLLTHLPTYLLRRADDALPLEEWLPWERFSLRVPTDELRTLPRVMQYMHAYTRNAKHELRSLPRVMQYMHAYTHAKHEPRSLPRVMQYMHAYTHAN